MIYFMDLPYSPYLGGHSSCFNVSNLLISIEGGMSSGRKAGTLKMDRSVLARGQQAKGSVGPYSHFAFLSFFAQLPGSYASSTISLVLKAYDKTLQTLENRDTWTPYGGSAV